MNKLMRLSSLIGLLIIYATACEPVREVTEPVSMILTWQQDPTTTMTIDWHTEPGDRALRTMEYRESGSSEWLQVESNRYDELPFSDRVVNRVELTGLTPNTYYHFRVGEFTREYKFRTMPENIDNQSITFAAGGDVRHEKEWMEQTNRRAMEYDPDFIYWGGDLAYDDGREDRMYRLYEFLDAVMNTLITEEGRVVPIIATIGNHEGTGYTHRIENFHHVNAIRMKHFANYYALFAFPGLPGYNVLDFGKYMSLIILDSMHSNKPSYQGQQEFLINTLAERSDFPHIFPKYHVAGWASVKGFKYRDEQYEVRNYFHPHFEEHNLPVVFENHDHAYKRTPPMRGNEVVEKGKGTVYIGDGNWGVGLREMVYHIPPEHIEKYDFDFDIPEDLSELQYNNTDIQWSETFNTFLARERAVPEDYPYENTVDNIPYLDVFAAVRHVIITELQGEGATFTVISDTGELVDEYSYESRW